MRARLEGDKELTAIGVLTPVGHRQHTFLRVRKELLVFEIAPQIARKRRASVDGFSSGPIPRSYISSLDHEIRHNAVELRSLVSKPFLGGAQGPEVFARDGCFVVVQVEDQSALLVVVDGEVHESADPAMLGSGWDAGGRRS